MNLHFHKKKNHTTHKQYCTNLHELCFLPCKIEHIRKLLIYFGAFFPEATKKPQFHKFKQKPSSVKFPSSYNNLLILFVGGSRGYD